MPLFSYEALADSGKKVGGKIDAQSLQDAKIKLVENQIAIIRITPVKKKDLKVRLSKKEVLLFTREIVRLLKASLPLYEAILALEEKYRGQKFHPILLDFCNQIRTGGSLSAALSCYEDSFDLLYVAMISNAEKTGNLIEALEELSELIQKQISLKKQIVSATLYPSILMFFCLIVLSSLIFFVVPSLKELFEGRSLHPFTQIVFAMSDFAIRAKGFLLLLFSCFVSFLSLIMLLPKWKKGAFRALVKLPILKNLLAKVALIRFFRASSTLLEGGLPLIQAFEQGKKVMRHPILEQLITEAEEKISQGESISKSFKHPLIPPLIPRMLSIAEESGNISSMFEQISQIYEEELDTTLVNFAAAAQPIMLVFLGALVGFVLLSVLLPLTDVSSFVN